MLIIFHMYCPLTNDRSLLKATVMLEYGEKLEKNATIHIDCLTAQSNMMKNIFEEAKPIKQAYANVKIIRREVKALLSPMMSKDDYLRKDVDENFAKVSYSHIHWYYVLPLADAWI
jgi:hypothetical protein